MMPLDTRNENKIESVKDLDHRQLSDIESFFKFYNQVFGKRFKVKGVRGPRTAEKLARQASWNDFAER